MPGEFIATCKVLILTLYADPPSSCFSFSTVKRGEVYCLFGRGGIALKLCVKVIVLDVESERCLEFWKRIRSWTISPSKLGVASKCVPSAGQDRR